MPRGICFRHGQRAGMQTLPPWDLRRCSRDDGVPQVPTPHGGPICWSHFLHPVSNATDGEFQSDCVQFLPRRQRVIAGGGVRAVCCGVRRASARLELHPVRARL